MALFLVLEDFTDGQVTLRAGSLVDDATSPVAALVASGLAAIAYNPPTMAAALQGYLAQRGSRPVSLLPEGDLTAALVAAGAIGGGGGNGSSGLMFTNYFPNDPAKGVYTDWYEFMAAVAQVPPGFAPVFTIATPGTPGTVPLAGMPATGWDFRGGTLRSFFRVTDAVVLDCPSGVKLDNLSGISNGLVLSCAPAAGTGVLEFSALPAGAPHIFQIGDGSYVRNTGAGALWRTKGVEPGGTTNILICFSCAFAVANPPLTPGAKLVHISNDGGQEDDGIVLVQGHTSLGGLPDDCIENSNANCGIVRIYDTSANPNTPNLAVWQPNLTGLSAFEFQASSAAVLAYDDLLLSPPLGSAFVQGALDAIKTALAARATSLQSTYAPTVTPITPGTLAAAAPNPFAYTRVGNLVRVTGLLDVTPGVLAGDNEIDLDLPVATASPTSAVGQCNGSSLPNAGSLNVMHAGGPVIGQAGNTARLFFSLAFASAPSPFKMAVDFSYLVT